jgi:hypothetical protein
MLVSPGGSRARLAVATSLTISQAGSALAHGFAGARFFRPVAGSSDGSDEVEKEPCRRTRRQCLERPGLEAEDRHHGGEREAECPGIDARQNRQIE